MSLKSLLSIVFLLFSGEIHAEFTCKLPDISECEKDDYVKGVCRVMSCKADKFSKLKTIAGCEFQTLEIANSMALDIKIIGKNSGSGGLQAECKKAAVVMQLDQKKKACAHKDLVRKASVQCNVVSQDTTNVTEQCKLISDCILAVAQKKHKLPICKKEFDSAQQFFTDLQPKLTKAGHPQECKKIVLTALYKLNAYPEKELPTVWNSDYASDVDDKVKRETDYLALQIEKMYPGYAEADRKWKEGEAARQKARDDKVVADRPKKQPAGYYDEDGDWVGYHYEPYVPANTFGAKPHEPAKTAEDEAAKTGDVPEKSRKGSDKLGFHAIAITCLGYFVIY